MRFAGVLAVALLLASCGGGLTPAIQPTSTVPVVPVVPATPRPAAPRDTLPREAPGSLASPRAPSANVPTPPAAPTTPAVVETPPIIDREFRGVWVASVSNIDWPSSKRLSSADQQRELVRILDLAVRLKLNAIILQVRPAADALYASRIEPWSEYLTGEQGKPPDPYWDPLAFAVAEAHARGLELHAWFNPYRARNEDARSPASSDHISRTNPSLVKRYAGFLWMDPAERLVRERTLAVVTDVVKRYDIDGVHIDDYFYPYPENDRRGREIPFPDDASWTRYRDGGGELSRGDWRRANVDALVEALDSRIHQTKPWVKFGISPFGIWRPGYPAGVRGLDAYSTLFADARKWLREGWLDYFTPQLYWPTTAVAQSYPSLLEWWVSENARGRHIWVGNFTSRTGGRGSAAWGLGEMLKQIDVTRQQRGASGNVHFSMKALLDNQAGLTDSLIGGQYRRVALVPESGWMEAPPPPRPAPAIVGRPGPLFLSLVTTSRVVPWLWTVRFKSDTGWVADVVPGATTRYPLPESATRVVVVTAVNRLGTESAPVSVDLSLPLPPSSPGRDRPDDR